MPTRWIAARREILYLALAGMEVCYLAPLVLALSQFASRFPAGRMGLAFFIVMLVAFWLVRWLTALNLAPRAQRDVALGVLVIWLLLTLRFTLYRHAPALSLAWLGELAGHLKQRALWSQDLTLIVATLLFWWRGFELARRSLDVDAVGLAFRFGVLLMAAAVLLVSQILDWSPTPWVFAFFFLSLMAVALARAEEVSRWRTGGPFPFDLGWLVSVAAAAGLVLLLAIGLIAVVSGESILHALALLGPVWEVLRVVFLVFVSLLFYLIYPILAFLASRLAGLMDDAAIEVNPPIFENPFQNPDRLTIRPSAFEPYEPLLRVLAVLAGMLIVALAVGGVWRARSRLGQVETDSAWAERRPGALGQRLRDGLGTLAGRLGNWSRWWAAASVRRIYAQMVAAASRRGHPRAPSETPYEYLPTLTQLWPAAAEPIRSITEAYVRVHYGEAAESAQELNAIRQAWESIQAADRLSPDR